MGWVIPEQSMNKCYFYFSEYYNLTFPEEFNLLRQIGKVGGWVKYWLQLRKCKSPCISLFVPGLFQFTTVSTMYNIYDELKHNQSHGISSGNGTVWTHPALFYNFYFFVFTSFFKKFVFFDIYWYFKIDISLNVL